jgi:hypothetical protein
MPVGATHGATFGSKGARIAIVKLNNSSPAASCFERLVELRERGLNWLAYFFELFPNTFPTLEG